MKKIPSGLTVIALVSLSILALGAPAGPTHHSGQLGSSETWRPSGNPHILDADVYTGDSVTLTIAPGCTVLVSAGAELYTGYAAPGSIVAVGTPDSGIAFKALSDTTPGSWRSVGFYHNTMPTARLSYVTVEYAGGNDDEGAVYVADCNIKMDHCTLRKNATVGVYAAALGYFADFSDNTITTSGEYPVRIDAEQARTLGAGNTLTGNSTDAVLVHGGIVKTAGTWLNHGVPYSIHDDVAIEDATNHPVLTIAPGTALKLFAGVEFYVGYSAPGGLIADGTGGPITITSVIAPPDPGDWASLSFYGNSIDSQCLVKSCSVEYGGSQSHGDIYIADCVPTVTGCDIGYSSAYGIYLAGAEYPDPDTLRANNYIHDYVDGDINILTGIEDGPKPQATGRRSEPTVLSGASGVRRLASCVVFDAMGRRVADPKPGVYFVRDAVGGGRSAVSVRKVVITR